ncbi:DUF5134 domain-containing protein [Nocardia zapadnayensis]|uniref:DUF5134 domain-containing protein n=1 Tax=Nocardia rhamnosiphila TaxID=426716 RepID=UPI0022476A82|nr:DUF5134 domain-containing protein [Nocardia zapadnayensis]MCX0272939.1 DUF5134 domain-containing protein [Nocardia zapadnayensis]
MGRCHRIHGDGGVLGGAIRRTRGSGRLSAILHVIMSLAMLAMVWPPLPDVPTVAGMTVFAGAAVVSLALLAARREHHLGHVYHAGMMATMVWMYAVMDSTLIGGTPMPTGGESMHAGHGSTMAMPNTMTMQLPSWAAYLNLTIGLVYLTVAALWIAHSYRGSAATGPAHRRGGAMQAVMAAATAAMFLSYTG